MQLPYKEIGAASRSRTLIHSGLLTIIKMESFQATTPRKVSAHLLVKLCSVARVFRAGDFLLYQMLVDAQNPNPH